MSDAMEFVAATHGGYRFEFPRITVILGANGSGKSTLLRAIKDAFPSVYVEGGRTIKIQDVIQLNRQNFQLYQDLDGARIQFKQKRRENLVARIYDGLMVLVRQEQVIKNAHSDAVVAWEEAGRLGEPPKREQPPLDRFFEQYNEIFPHLHLSHDRSSGRITVVNDNVNTPYGPSSLSDGEKQVFSLMVDMLQLEDEYSVVVVDEPELNLHPELAERLWALLESEYQEKHFLYATHSIQFALRSNVDALYVISSDSKKIRKIENISEVPRADLERFLGGVPGILNANVVVATEGHEKSFDSIFYRWVLGDAKAEIFPCGNCSDVMQVIAKKGLWGQVSSEIRLAGVVDSDFRSDQELDRARGDHLRVLQFHEAESFICLPEVLAAAAVMIGSQHPLPTASEISAAIFSELQRQRLPIALRRAFSDSSFTVRLSLERSVLAAVNTKEEAMDHIRQKSAAEVSKAVDAMSEAVFEARLDNELQLIDGALRDRDVELALKIVPGKQMLALLAPRAGCKNGTDLMRSIKRNLKIENFPLLKQLADDLSACIQ